MSLFILRSNQTTSNHSGAHEFTPVFSGAQILEYVRRRHICIIESTHNCAVLYVKIVYIGSSLIGRLKFDI